MSTSFSEQTPAVVITQQPSASHSTHGSVGLLIAVLVVVVILSIVAIMIGKLCSGRRIMGCGQYDIESWAEAKCHSCIDGRISPPPPRPNMSAVSAPASTPAQPHQEAKQESNQSTHKADHDT